MGEVYRARDPMLKRDVAIKVLPETYSRDSERLFRFQQEAEATAALNHPNILAIFQVGAQDGTHYIVAELLQGETLRSALSRGAISLRTSLQYASGIANGLSAAHDRGIIHRDLKPENLFLTKDGQVKILDFGLAKLAQSAPESKPEALTLDVHTDPDRVLGTMGYMAPEQLRGQTADARADIFAFGAVLYEMLSGKRAFRGASTVDTQTAILREEPDHLASLNRQVPPAVCRIVSHCLEKAPERRFQSARDLAFHLETTSSALDSGDSAPTITPLTEGANAHYSKTSMTWVFCAALMALVAWGAWWLRGRMSAKDTVGPIEFLRLTNLYGMEESPTISPDGKSLAFVSDAGGNRQILVRLLSGGSTLQLTQGGVDHLGPRWARDSASIYYYTPPSEPSQEAAVWEISALGGGPRRVLNSLGELDPSHNGKFFSFFRLSGGNMQLVRSDTSGSNIQVLAQFPPKTSCSEPRWSADDSQIAFIQSIDRWSGDIYVVAASGGSPRRVTRERALISGYSWLADDRGFVYSSSRASTMLYLPSQNLFRVSLDGSDVRRMTSGDDDLLSPEVDPAGRVIASQRRIRSDIWKIPAGQDARENVRLSERITRQTSRITTPSVSPDDKEIAYLADVGGHANLWILDLGTRQSRQLTYEKDLDTTIGVPIWSPDGSVIAYARQRRDQNTQYYLIRPDGSDNHLFVDNATWFTWSGDSRWAYFVRASSPANATPDRLMKVPAVGGAAIEVRKGILTGPAVARDGTSLYFQQALVGVNGLWDYEVYSAKPETADPRPMARFSGQRVPDWQGLHPVLSHDGKWLAMPLNDRYGTNVWLMSTEDGKMRQLTDFGDGRTFIVRRLTWTSDDKFIYAAIGEGDADIVLLGGLLH